MKTTTNPQTIRDYLARLKYLDARCMMNSGRGERYAAYRSAFVDTYRKLFDRFPAAAGRLIATPRFIRYSFRVHPAGL